MSIVQDYLDYTQKWKAEFGSKTMVLLQVGSFFECYSLRKEGGGIYGIDSPYGSNIEEFASINDMIIANKTSMLHNKQVVMAGVGVAYIDKYLKRLQEHDYTIVLYKQDINGKNTTRSLSEIISPGTFFSPESEELSNNIMCAWLHKSVASKYSIGSQVTIGVANIDIFTGKTSLFQFSADYNHNPSTYDELERYISAYNPSECLLVANMPEKVINDIIGFVGLQNSKIHKVDLSTTNTSTMQTFAKNAEKQIYQKEILKKFYPHVMEQDFFQAFPTHFVATQAFCFLLDFVHQHSPNLVKKLAEPVFENYTDKLILANHSLYQLNIIDDSRHTGKFRSVSSLINNCVTTMGKRQFLYNLHNPITNTSVLNASYAITEHMLAEQALAQQALAQQALAQQALAQQALALADKNLWQIIRNKLSGIKDLEKLHRKLIMNKICPKDFALLAHDLIIISSLYEDTSKDITLTKYMTMDIGKDISGTSISGTSISGTSISGTCNEILADLNKVFDLDKCLSITDINGDTDVFINKDISSTMDKLVKESMDGREKLEAIREYLSSVIKTLEKGGKDTQYIKIHETPKSDAVLIGTSRRVALLKSHVQKQNSVVTIAYNSTYSKKEETFTFSLLDLEFNTMGSNKKDLSITNSQIKQITNDVQCSREKIVKEMTWVFNNYVNLFAKFESYIQEIVKYTTLIDIIQCKCYIAHKFNYCKPVIANNDSNKAFLSFTGIRHPLIEHLQTNELYVTNDLSLGMAEARANGMARAQARANGILLYGTNAVGKTSFIKSIGIALIMAQAGLYVPCQTFTYSPYNYIFTRILGNDNLFKGLSTFAVEMSELRTILKMADENSLVLGDELCSGTESDSALSIFTAGLEILHKKESTFLFATHFHEINNYEEIRALTKLKMLHMAVSYDRERNVLIYDRKLRDGPGESMYGLEVCKSLNLPADFLQRAHDIRMKYNVKDKNILALNTTHFNAQKIVGNCELCHIEPASEVHHLQPQNSAKKSNDYIEGEQVFHKNHVANLLSICEKCHKGMHSKSMHSKGMHSKGMHSKSIHKIKKTTKSYELNL